MRLGAIPESPIDWIVARLNVAPRPLLETQMAYTLARVVMVATKVGAFDALAGGPATPREVAERCGTSAVGTEKLLFALAGAGYVRADGDRYALTPVSRKWLLRSSPALDRRQAPVPVRRVGVDRGERGLRAHRRAPRGALDDRRRALAALPARHARDGQRLRRRGGQADARAQGRQRHARHRRLARLLLGRALPPPRGASFDDPRPAVGGRARGAAAGRRGDGRPGHTPGRRALSDDLGGDAYDLVLVAQLVHHFSDSEDRELATRIARALRPGGVYAVLDAFRPRSAGDAGQVGALLEFYFALTSQSGTWAAEEISGWQRQAGLGPRRPVRLRTAPGVGIQAAVKPG